MRFAVTGFGVISPIGIGEESFFAGLESGRSGVRVDAQAERHPPRRIFLTLQQRADMIDEGRAQHIDEAGGRG